MAAKPFWTLRVHDKRDVLVARQKARQIAHLLHFPPLEEACIAAGTFAIAAAARDHYEICDVCFQLDSQHLAVFARPLNSDEAAVPASTNRKRAEGCDLTSGPSVASTRVEPAKSAPPMKLSKPLPETARHYSVEELSFLIARINDQAPADLFGELGKQNQEILLLLHLLAHPEGQLKEESTSAA